MNMRFTRWMSEQIDNKLRIAGQCACEKYTHLTTNNNSSYYIAESHFERIWTVFV